MMADRRLKLAFFPSDKWDADDAFDWLFSHGRLPIDAKRLAHNLRFTIEDADDHEGYVTEVVMRANKPIYLVWGYPT